MNKINIAELLKDCPQGMELDCTMYDNLYFDKIYDNDYCIYKIECYTIVNDIKTAVNFTKFGTFNTHTNSKCVIFPKGKTTWEGFIPPCEFKDGDIITYKCEQGLVSMILRKFVNFVEIHFHCALSNNAKGFITDNYIIGEPRYVNHATEEEKQKLLKEIEKNGYYWDEEKKCLLKLPDFKDGDIVALDTFNNSLQVFIFNKWVNKKTGVAHCYLLLDDNDILDLKYGAYYIERLATKEEKERLFDAIKHKGYEWNPEKKCLKKLTSKFKVNDKIKNIKDGIKGIVTKISDGNIYATCREGDFYFSLVSQDEWELIPNKFDLSALKPYKSEILYRNSPGGYWKPAFWGAYISENSEQHSNHNYLTTDGFARYCIPYKCNEHLLGTQDDCSKYYKTWEE